MTDDKNITRAYSQDRQVYRHSSISIKRKTSIQSTRIPDNYYSNRNCPEMLSIFALSNKNLEDRKKQIYHSISSDAQYFNMINYQIQSRSATPLPILGLDIDDKQDIQTKLPKVTPRVSIKYFRTHTN